LDGEALYEVLSKVLLIFRAVMKYCTTTHVLKMLVLLLVRLFDIQGAVFVGFGFYNIPEWLDS